MHPGPNGSAEFQEGKSAGGAELRLKLSRAGTAYLQGALQNPGFGEKHLLAIFANPALPASLIQQIAGNKQWFARLEVQRAIVFHRNSPRTLKMNMVHFLGWKDLSRAMEDAFMPPPVKRAAETLLRARVEEMALGEKIALARVAGAGVIPALRSDPQEPVIAALLENPRLSEQEVLALCAEERTPAAVLSTVGCHPKWRDRNPVKKELLRNPRTPATVSLRFLDTLSTEDLRELVSSPRLARLVRTTAKQILESRRGFIDRNGAVS